MHRSCCLALQRYNWLCVCVVCVCAVSGCSSGFSFVQCERDQSIIYKCLQKTFVNCICVQMFITDCPKTPVNQYSKSKSQIQNLYIPIQMIVNICIYFIILFFSLLFLVSPFGMFSSLKATCKNNNLKQTNEINSCTLSIKCDEFAECSFF